MGLRVCHGRSQQRHALRRSAGRRVAPRAPRFRPPHSHRDRRCDADKSARGQPRHAATSPTARSISAHFHWRKSVPHPVTEYKTPWCAVVVFGVCCAHDAGVLHDDTTGRLPHHAAVRHGGPGVRERVKLAASLWRLGVQPASASGIARLAASGTCANGTQGWLAQRRRVRTSGPPPLVRIRHQRLVTQRVLLWDRIGESSRLSRYGVAAVRTPAATTCPSALSSVPPAAAMCLASSFRIELTACRRIRLDRPWR